MTRWLLTMEVELSDEVKLSTVALALEEAVGKLDGVTYSLMAGAQLLAREPAAAVEPRSDL